MIRNTLLFTAFFCLFINAPVVADVPEDQFFDSDGVRIRYVDVGPRDGEPLVLIHGFTQRIETAWVQTGVIDALDDDYRVIALDCRGHGKSGKPHDAKMYGTAMAADVLLLLDHLEIDKAHLVGYSMGGRIVYKLVADHPDRVISAMPCGMGWAPPSPAFDEFREHVAKTLEETGSIRPMLERLTSDEAVIERFVEEVRASNDTIALAAVQRGIPGLRPDRSKLESNSVPCMCVIGEIDPFRERAEAMAEYMSNLEITLIKDADHGAAYKNPAFLSAIRAFIARHASNAAGGDSSH